MKVRFTGETGALNHGQVYEVLALRPNPPSVPDYYQIIDNSGEAYIYSPGAFEIVEHGEVPRLDIQWEQGEDGRCIR